MLLEYISKIKDLYKNDTKVLRTGTLLYGHLFDSRWQTMIQRPLTAEEIYTLEEEFGAIPQIYKQLLLITNGCYLFDLIIIAGKPDNFKGMPRTEMIYQPMSINVLISKSDRKKVNEKGLFVFASSMVNENYYALDENQKVHELGVNRFNTIKIYENLEELLNEVFEEGKKLVESGTYLDFY
jgi:hypothetical protein